MIWNEEIELMPRPQLEALQSERLAKLATYVYERVPFYQQKAVWGCIMAWRKWDWPLCLFLGGILRVKSCCCKISRPI